MSISAVNNLTASYSPNRPLVNKTSSQVNKLVANVDKPSAILEMSIGATSAATNSVESDRIDQELRDFQTITFNYNCRWSVRCPSDPTGRRSIGCTEIENFLRSKGIFDSDGQLTEKGRDRNNWKFGNDSTTSGIFVSERRFSDEQDRIAERLGMTESQGREMADFILKRFTELISAVSGGIVDFDTMRGIEEQILGEMREMLSQFHEANQQRDV